MSNVVVLRGVLSRPAAERVLSSGDRLVALEVTTRREGAARADSVPVSWFGAPASAATLDAGDEVVVVGHVTRRFFQAGGVTQSRTEVVATAVHPPRASKKVQAAVSAAADSLLEMAGGGRA